MEINGLFSALFVGIVIGLLGRIIAGGREPVGCFLTIAIGIFGAAIGAGIGEWLDWGFWLTFLAQIVIAAVVVLPFARMRNH